MSFDLTATNLSTLAALGIQHESQHASDSNDAMYLTKPTPGPSKQDSFELRPIPAHLSESGRRPSTLTRKGNHFHSFDASIPVDTFISDEENFPETTRAPSERSTKMPANVSVTSVNSSASAVNENHLSKHQKRASLVHFLAICFSMWLQGWNDGTLGPMLPRIQSQYHIGFSIVSILFVGNCVGYVTAAALNIWFNDRFGYGKIMVAGAMIQLSGYLIIIPSPPFPLMICAYVVIGFGMSLQCAQANGFVGSLRQHMTLKLGVMHAAYGLGAFMSPFSSTYFSHATGRKWAFHYIISGGLAVTNILISTYVFRLRRQEDLLREAGQEPNAESAAQPTSSPYRQILQLKAMPLLTVFSLIYVGLEVTLGGWIVTYIIRERHGGSNAGYISSGFFGGLTLGRVCLIWLNQMVGERRIIFFYAIIAICLELTIWFVPSIIGNGVAVSLIGVVLGPMFPLLVSHMTHILPQWLLAGCVGLVAGIGNAGSAVLPFATGLLASKYGIASLQPFLVSMMVCMSVVWAFVPGSTRRVD